MVKRKNYKFNTNMICTYIKTEIENHAMSRVIKYKKYKIEISVLSSLVYVVKMLIYLKKINNYLLQK